MFNPTLFNVDGLKIRILGMFFKPLNPWHMLEHTLRRSLLELFENRRRQIHCPASSNFQTHFSTLCWSLLVIFLVSNVAVLYLAQYSVGCRTGTDRNSEIWTCEKTQARQHCFDSKRIVTKRSRATFALLFVEQ